MTIPGRLSAVAAVLLLAATAARAELPADVAAYLEASVDNGAYVGVMVGFVDGDETSIASFGVASRETGEPPTASTVFEIGSITKTFTAALLAEAALRDELDLADTVQSHVPDGVTLAVVGGRPIRLEDVATHRSGLPRLPPNLRPADPADPYADYDEDLLWQAIDTVLPSRPPGELAEYSNFGFGLLGEILARDAGTDYRALVRERIFAPLAMTSTDTVLTDSLRARAAQGYAADGSPSPYWRLDAIAGAGAINSTLGDMLRYLEAQMAAAAGGAAAGGDRELLARAMAETQGPRADFAPNGSIRVGLAWLTLPGGGGYWHDGGTGGFRSFIGFMADGRRGVVVLTNTGGQGVNEVGYHLLDASLPLPPLRQRVSLSGAELDEYLGVYAITPEIGLTLTRRDEQLLVQLTGQASLPFDASGPGRFFNQAVQADIEFERDANGRIVALLLTQGGVRTRADRLGADGQPLVAIVETRLEPRALDPYVGNYRLAPQVIVTVSRDNDRLLAQLTGQPAVEIFPDREDRFVYRIIDAAIEFGRDDAGRVNSLTLHQNGAALTAPRMPD